jgi:hypothetical protein
MNNLPFSKIFVSHLPLEELEIYFENGLVCPWSRYGMQDQKGLGTVERV